MALLKLGQREHMEQFRKGQLYMNTLKYFRDLESDPARADHYEGAQIRRGGEAAVVRRERPEKADDEGTQDIDEDRSPGKLCARDARDRERQPGARHAAERAADADPNVSHRRRPIILRSEIAIMAAQGSAHGGRASNGSPDPIFMPRPLQFK